MKSTTPAIGGAAPASAQTPMLAASAAPRGERSPNPAPAPRRLSSAHFAFMRALAQGLDERASWDRYLSVEGEHTDIRTVRRTIAWIRDAFAAAARRQNKPGTARLILLDPDRFTSSPALPSLAEFAQANGLEDCSEAEQLEAYEEAYPHKAAGGGAGRDKAERDPAGKGRGGQGGSRQLSRRARVIERQLEALRWLQDLVAQDPRPGDGVAAWLNPSLAGRLERAGVATLQALVERINGIGARWHLHVPGVGQRKGNRILEWLHAHEPVLGLRVGVHVARPRAQLSPVTLEAVVPAATALRPYEKFVLPGELDGRAGRYRAPRERCLLLAANDHEAIAAWLASKRTANAPAGQGKNVEHVDPGGQAVLSSTQRAYRKEAERLLLWAVLERKTALSSLTVEDAEQYRSFLADPPTTWCGPRHHQRWSPLWRPLEGPLSAVALRQALIILKSLFAFLVGQGYVTGNPFAAVGLPANPRRPLGSRRTLTRTQWDHIDALLHAHGTTEAQRRLRRAMRWLYATGLRLAEITGARCEDLEQIEYRTCEGSLATGWLLSVAGKGGRARQVPVPAALVEELGDELARCGFERQVDALRNRGIAVLARFNAETKQPASWSTSGLYQAIKTFLARAADSLPQADAEQLTKASTHWLRHSHASNALQGRGGQGAVSLLVVQNNLGHASLATTSMYVTAEREERVRAMEGFWKPST